MDSGVINEESISNLLRSISQRKKNGVLEINLPDRQLSIFFAKGKVVDAVQPGATPAAEVLTLLRAAGWVSKELNILTEEYGDVFRALSGKKLPRGPVSDDLFRRVVKHRVLDLLYSLEMGTGAYYTFKVQMVDGSKDFAPAISSGQILLDLVSLKQDEQRFSEVFGPDVIIRRGEEPGALSEEETVIWEELGAAEHSIDNLARLAMLSRFHLLDALLGMFERGVVVTRSTDAAAASSAPASPSQAAAAAPAQKQSTVAGAANTAPSSVAGITASSHRLLQDSRIPYALLIIGLLAGILAPILRWGGVWGQY